MAKFRPCGPTARAVIQQMRNKKLGWAKSVGELIDNSVGNGATEVKVRWEPHSVECIDNGVGCNEEKFAALVSLGVHVEDDVVLNSVSRFGVGAKEAFVYFGGPTHVCSSRGDLHQYIEVDWDAFAEAWDYEDVETGEAARRECVRAGLGEHGVAVICPHHERQMSEKTFFDVQKQLSDLFWAAVETGVTISIEYKPNKKRSKVIGGKLSGKELPEFIVEHSIDTELQLADGRPVRIVGGVLAPNVRLSTPGFEYIYGHRVVVTAGGLGAGSMDFERCYFRVFLLGEKEDWRVTTNKVGLHDADEAALGQAVYDLCKPLLEHSQSEAMATLEDQELLDEVSDILTSANRKHAKRQRAVNNSGTVSPTGKGKEHSTATTCHDKPGKYRTRGSNTGKIKLIRKEFEPEKEHLAGIANVKDRVVRINVLHPFIARCLAERDKIGLFVTAMSIWSDAWIRTDETGQMWHQPRIPFSEKLSAMLKMEDNTTA